MIHSSVNKQDGVVEGKELLLHRNIIMTGFTQEPPLKHNVVTTEGKLSNNMVCSSFSGVACVAQWVNSLSLI